MRARTIKKREVLPDLVYKSRVFTKMVNILMLHGEKATAVGILQKVLGKINEDKKEAITVLEHAVKNVMPAQEVRSRRVGGATYQVPMPVKHDRAEALALRWIIRAARAKKGKPMEEKLLLELQNASQNTGDAIRKREETHKMAEANRAFAHFRF